MCRLIVMMVAVQWKSVCSHPNGWSVIWGGHSQFIFSTTVLFHDCVQSWWCLSVGCLMNHTVDWFIGMFRQHQNLFKLNNVALSHQKTENNFLYHYSILLSIEDRCELVKYQSLLHLLRQEQSFSASVSRKCLEPIAWLRGPNRTKRRHILRETEYSNLSWTSLCISLWSRFWASARGNSY